MKRHAPTYLQRLGGLSLVGLLGFLVAYVFGLFLATAGVIQ